jgi:hypothetical protein
MNNPANVGRVTPISVNGLTAADVTQIVTASYPEARQLVVTLAQVTRLANASTPWVAPRSSPAFNGPALPAAAVLRVRCRWGAGGVSFLSIADYPLAGGSFSVMAQSVSVDAVWFDLTTGLPATPTFASAAEIPVVGAFLAEGVSAVAEPLRWTDPGLNLAAAPGPGNDAELNVVPYARTLALVSDTPLATDLLVFWRTAGAVNLQVRRYTGAVGAGLDVLIDVPPMAVAVQVANLSPSPIFIRPIWRLGLM